MIRLKEILGHRERSHGWMTPSGKMLKVNDTHMTSAMAMIPNWKQDKLDPMMELWKKGYLRITYMYDGSLIANNEVRSPNEKQLATLKDIAVEGGHEKISWDSGNDEKLLWTSHDTLQ